MNDDFRTIPPRSYQADGDDFVTMKNAHERGKDGRFKVGDIIIGRYKILAELGQGGMGVVYRCLDETAGVQVALKALPPELSHNSLEMEDIKENFQLVSKLIHQNIAISKQLERDPASGNYYLIMECCEGEDLRRWIRRKRQEGNLTAQDVVPIIRQVAEALDYAHEMLVIHRDIKPGNIMIDQYGRIKVLDFGLAAQIHTSMTRVSMAYHGTSGTGPYMAPEQWRGRAQGAAADQYALAVMTYEMFAGHLPFESPDAAVLREAVLNDTAENIAGTSAVVQNAIRRAMSKNPAERFESCCDFVSALNGKKVKKAKAAKSSSGNFPKWAVALICVGVVVLAAAGYGWYRYSVHIENEKRIAFERQQKINNALAGAEASLAAEKWQEALKYTAEVLALAPENIRARDISSAAEKGQIRQIKAKMYELKVKISAKLDRLNSGNIDRGQRFGEYLNKANEKYRFANEAFSSGDFKSAVQLYGESDAACSWVDENLARRTASAQTISQLKALSSEAEKYRAGNLVSEAFRKAEGMRNVMLVDFEAAKFQNCSDKTQETLELYKNVIADAKRLRRQELNTQINSAFQSKQYTEAARIISDAKQLFAGDKELNRLEEKVVKAQREEKAQVLISNAKKEINAQNWERAIKFANDALAITPSNQEAGKIIEQAESNLINNDVVLRKYLLRLCRTIKDPDYGQREAVKRLQKFDFRNFAQEKYSTWCYELLSDAIDVGASLGAVKYLVENKNVKIENITKYSYMTPLCHAVKCDNTAVAKYLISRGAQLNPKYGVDYGGPPLNYVKNIAMAKLLIDAGADPMWQNKNGETLADKHDFEVSQFLISCGAKLSDPQDIYRKAANDGKIEYLKNNSAEVAMVDDIMVSAAGSGNLEVIKYLESLNMSFKAVNKNKNSVLHAACNKKGSVEIFQYLSRKSGLSIDLKNKNGWTPLMDAIYCKNQKLIEYLLENGADVKAKNEDGYTPLYYAISNKQLNIVSLLLAKGADIKEKYKNGNTPLYQAVYEDNLELTRFLIGKGADVNEKYDNGWTPLYMAINKQNLAMVRFLVEKGANVNEKYNNWTLIYHAYNSKNRPIIRYLVDHGADLNQSNDNGHGWCTALANAVYSKDAGMVKFLLDLGADPMKVDASGKTPMSLASTDNITSLLLSKVKNTHGGQLIASNVAEFKAFIQTAPENATIKLKSGTYNFNDNIYIKKAIKIIGESRDTTILNFTDDFNIWESTSNVPVVLQNLSMNFTDKSNLSMRARTTVFISNCRLSSDYYYAVYTSDHCRLSMKDCYSGRLYIGNNSIFTMSKCEVAWNNDNDTVYMKRGCKAVIRDSVINGVHQYGTLYCNEDCQTLVYNTKIANTNGPAARADGSFYAENCTFRGTKHAFNAGHEPAYFNSCRFESSSAGVNYSRKVKCYNCTYQGYDKMFNSGNAQVVYSKIYFPKLNIE